MTILQVLLFPLWLFALPSIAAFRLFMLAEECFKGSSTEDPVPIISFLLVSIYTLFVWPAWTGNHYFVVYLISQLRVIEIAWAVSVVWRYLYTPFYVWLLGRLERQTRD